MVSPSPSLDYTPGNSTAPSSDTYLRAAGVSPGATAMAAAMRARAARASRNLKPKPQEVVVLYGSQTGNAMEIAKSLSAEAQSRGIPSKAMAMEEFSLTKLANTAVAIFVVSSTGDGDPPDNCASMYNSIRRKSHSSNLLSNVKFTVLGLGDSNFTRFMAIPRTFRNRLGDLGAQPFYKFGEADEVEGLEEIVDKWIAGIWEPLKEATQNSTDTNLDRATKPAIVSPDKPIQPSEDAEAPSLIGVPAFQPCHVVLTWHDPDQVSPDLGETKDGKEEGSAHGILTSNPVWVNVSHSHVMTAAWSDRKVIHLELEAEGDGFASMNAGDSIGIHPQNNETVVEKLLDRIGIKDEQRNKVFRVVSGDSRQPALLHIKQPCTLRHAFLHYCAITSVLKKGFIRTLAESCKDEKEKHQALNLCSRGGKEAYRTQVQEKHLGILDFLEMFPSCNPPLEHILDSLPPLVPRLYSLSNSPSAEGSSKVEVAFSVVRMNTGENRVFEGVCTTWLERRLNLAGGSGQRNTEQDFEGGKKKPVRFEVFPKSGGAFRPPSSLKSPIIMIGPGTGISPFRGFLQERKKMILEQRANEKHNLDANGKYDGNGNAVLDSLDPAPCWLFFGCRREDEDYLYREDLESYKASGVLSHLVVAFSRATESKLYVQDKLKFYGEEVTSLLLNPLTHVYVCGDGANMAKDVHAALLFLLEKHGNKKEGLGVAHLNNMVNESRYVRDIWS